MTLWWPWLWQRWWEVGMWSLAWWLRLKSWAKHGHKRMRQQRGSHTWFGSCQWRCVQRKPHNWRSFKPAVNTHPLWPRSPQQAKPQANVSVEISLTKMFSWETLMSLYPHSNVECRTSCTNAAKHGLVGFSANYLSPSQDFCIIPNNYLEKTTWCSLFFILLDPVEILWALGTPTLPEESAALQAGFLTVVCGRWI